MTSADRRFYSWLMIAFGPLFVLGGFGAAFTTMGALFVWTGLAMLAAGVLLRTPLPGWTAVLVATVMWWGLVAYTAFVYPGRGL